MYSRRSSWLWRSAGILLVGAGLTATVYGLRVSLAQITYFRLKFGAWAERSPEQRQPAAETAQRRYRHNYYLSLLMAEAYWNERVPEGGTGETSRVNSAAYWCRRGVEQNPYRRELRWLEARLAGLESPVQAASLWRTYVDFAFWDRWNIARLIELSAQAGQFREAAELLPLLRGKPEYAAALKAYADAWRNEPRSVPGDINP